MQTYHFYIEMSYLELMRDHQYIYPKALINRRVIVNAVFPDVSAVCIRMNNGSAKEKPSHTGGG